MTVLIDTNVLLALAFSRDANHVRAKEVLTSLQDEERIVAAPVLTELFYMTTVRVSYSHAVQIFTRTRQAFAIQSLTDADMDRMQTIMSTYADASFDYTDTAIMAVAERLRVTRICTFDRRDFSIYRPVHTDTFDLLPHT